QIPVGIEGVQKRVHATAIPHISQPGPVLQRTHKQFLLDAALPHPLMRDQRVRNLAERSLNRSLILNEGALLQGFGEPHVRFQPSRCKYRLSNLRRESPNSAGTRE